MDREHFLDVDPPLQVVGNLQPFELRFSLHLVSVEVATGQEDELFFEIPFRLKESVKLCQCVLDRHSSIDLFLLNACQLCAKGCKNRVNCRLDVSLLLCNHFLLLYIYHNDRKLDDLVELQSLGIVSVFTLALEIVDHEVLDGA